MYHIGHARVLEQAKKLFPNSYLIVGVSGDKETIEKKGKIVMNEFERAEILKHCKWVDEVICPCPWILTVDFLRKNNIHYVAHDEAPYGGEGQEDIYADVKKLVDFSSYYHYRACLKLPKGLTVFPLQISSWESSRTMTCMLGVPSSEATPEKT